MQCVLIYGFMNEVFWYLVPENMGQICFDGHWFNWQLVHLWCSWKYDTETQNLNYNRISRLNQAQPNPKSSIASVLSAKISASSSSILNLYEITIQLAPALYKSAICPLITHAVFRSRSLTDFCFHDCLGHYKGHQFLSYYGGMRTDPEGHAEFTL